jgi:hypothetical protein
VSFGQNKTLTDTEVWCWKQVYVLENKKETGFEMVSVIAA